MVRKDLAEVGLAHRVFAPHYAQGEGYRVVRATSVHAKPRLDADIAGAIAAGDAVEVFDIAGGWAWVRSATAVGYVPVDAIARS